jgi:hypothetical protein
LASTFLSLPDKNHEPAIRALFQAQSKNHSRPKSTRDQAGGAQLHKTPIYKTVCFFFPFFFYKRATYEYQFILMFKKY